MRITCYYSEYSDMGYIYLKPPKIQYDEYKLSKNEITKYVDSDQLNIPYITDLEIASYLDKMTFAVNTFKADHEERYDTEYGNDMDEQGYIIGIELNLNHERFIELIKNEAFKLIKTVWRNNQYHLITFDHLENVFKQGNIIYKLTDQEDAFVIVQLVEPEKLGYQYSDSKDRHPIALFKALISARDDIYPPEYLCKEEFFLQRD
ncbi:hypothetical protein EHS13_23110 [Paenibacillus psychroresistens]|uniref:Uncharacterized protein n=1 Tax=Paenibacillus psychroresistens TaxID=1778678 RepID=A0A6B8RMG3_9BACL|nr:hypothetical protein EHS13_23110 [Paenibacillus psychroresistens]